MLWEQRWHPLREEWVIVAVHRDDRPWAGQSVPTQRDEDQLPSYDPNCPLCPGNVRVSGKKNDNYKSVFVFDNDLPCVGPHAPVDLAEPTGIYENRPALGVSRVVCYSPLHNTSLAELEEARFVELFREWQQQYVELGDRPEVDHVLIFENRGKVVGVSNPHPHCQIYATNFVCKTTQHEVDVSRRYWQQHHRILFQDIVAAEQADGRRILEENDSAIAFLPYFARFPYETFVAPKETHANLALLSNTELRDLARVLKNVLVRFDNLWQQPFPYVMVLHQAPTDGGNYDTFHFHVEFYPPLRKPHLLKYLAGPELGGGTFLNDTSPEEKAAELRAQATVHYKSKEAAQKETASPKQHSASEAAEPSEEDNRQP